GQVSSCGAQGVNGVVDVVVPLGCSCCGGGGLGLGSRRSCRCHHRKRQRENQCEDRDHVHEPILHRKFLLIRVDPVCCKHPPASRLGVGPPEPHDSIPSSQPLPVRFATCRQRGKRRAFCGPCARP